MKVRKESEKGLPASSNEVYPRIPARKLPLCAKPTRLMKAGRALYFVSLLALTIFSTLALTPSERSAIRTTLESAKTADLPQIAEDLMREAKNADRGETAKMILEYVVVKRPGAARLVFTNMLKLYPEIFATVTRGTYEAATFGGDTRREPPARGIQGLQYIAIRQARRDDNPAHVPPPPIPTSEGASSFGAHVSIGARGVFPRSRGAAAGPATGLVTQSNTPINTSTGGNGNGTFIGLVAIPAQNPICICY